jgi:hypothetical protein
VKKALVKREWLWWRVVVYSSYELGAPIEYMLPQKFFSKATAKEIAKAVRFNTL